MQTFSYQATHQVHALLFWTLAAAAAVLAVRGPALRRAILATAGPMRRVSTDSFGLTLKAIALSALVAAPVSLTLALVGWQLASSLEAGPFAKQVGGALLSISVILYYLRSFRILCIPGGVADKHFRWPADALVRLRRSFDWLAYLLLPVGFVALVIYNSDDAALAGSLGRMAVLLLLVGIAVIFARLLHPSSGPPARLPRRQPAEPRQPPARPLVPAGGRGSPGPGRTGAHRIPAHRRDPAAIHHPYALVGPGPDPGPSGHSPLAVGHPPPAGPGGRPGASGRTQGRTAPRRQRWSWRRRAAVDLASLDSQTRRLVSAIVIGAGFFGLWGVWSDVLPAFTALDRFALWQHTGLVDGVDAQVPVTLGDILLVVAIILVSAIAARNLPAVLEILLLQYTELSSGSRYTATTLTKYAITIAGACWSSPPWG